MRRALRRSTPPVVLVGMALRPRSSVRQRRASVVGLLALWSVVYARYRRESRARTAHERELLRSASAQAFSRHYNERVPTMEEELDLWGAYHRHRHEMRYDLVAGAIGRHLRPGARVLDVGSGSMLVADRLGDRAVTYVGLDYGNHHVAYAAAKVRPSPGRRLVGFVSQGDGENLPFADASFDVVVMTEVIEHLLRPDRAVWEVARVLRPGGVFVMTTNNACEMPLRSPTTHLFAWVERAIGFRHPGLVSLRPWVWPEPVDPALLCDGAGEVYLPHTHHIAAETSAMLARAGLETVETSTFEFPPPQSASARWLEARGAAGRRVVDALEAVARRTPLVNRLGCHLFIVARRTSASVGAEPPPGVWPGPFSSP
ncbi:MAG: class I SAM-dependent methyltransferase [Acidimicrobiales bacterium]